MDMVAAIFSPSMHHDYQFAVTGLAQCYPALLILAVVFVNEGEGQWIAEYLCGVFEADPVFA
jgi:hypothetical protein